MRLSTAVAIAWLSSALQAHAVLLVDTGSPPPSIGGVALDTDQSLGASFDVPYATTITEVEGFIRSSFGGLLSANLYAGAPGGTALFAAVREVPDTISPQWESFGQLDWTVAAGTYTLTFEPITFSGYMPTPAPSPLGDEWNQTLNRPWEETGGVNGLGIRVHVTHVPEPASWALIAGALGIATLSRLRAGQSS